MGTFYIAPKIGAMGNIRLSIHSFEHSWLRDFLLKRRKELGLSQRALGMKMGVVHSFIG
ncbi:hypothetical protein [Exercitatus varius]|nr:hypothetical protein [Exercitatus varius]MDG2950625.1 hypothetical protein [Exercitatus varius]